jgi:hypothetical protein
MLRFGMMPLDLQASSDTPLFGASIGRVVDEYNAAAEQRGTARIAPSDLSVAATMMVFAPGFEKGSGHYFFRVEAPLGFSDALRSFGLGMYPLNLQVEPRRGFVLYGSAGGIASWLDRPGSGDIGGLVAVRAAGGLRFSRHIVVEIGYSAFALGGTFNRERLATMTDPNAMMKPADLGQAISGGEARGLVDASVGLAF